MKKLLFLLLSLLLFATPCFAEKPTTEENDIRQVVTDFNDLNYRFTAGLSYTKFRDIDLDMYIKTRVFKDAYPQSVYIYHINSINTVYEDISDLWKKLNESQLSGLSNDTVKKLLLKYPDLEAKVKKDNSGTWNSASAIVALNSIANDRIAVLATIVRTNYEAK